MLHATADDPKLLPDDGQTKAYDPVWLRLLVRAGAVSFLGATLVYGLVLGGHAEHPLNPIRSAITNMAHHFGYLAEDIRISELQHNKPQQVLSAIGVTPGRPLFGFDANKARALLNNLDWVKAAQVRRIHPNRLEIDVIEREPFIIWQTGENYYVLDREGRAISSLDARRYRDLPLVTGDGAQQVATRLVNHIEAYPTLKSKLIGAARVGERRWTLYLRNGAKILLPEGDINQSLKVLAGLQLREKVLDRPVERIDLRLAGQIIVAVREPLEKSE